MSDEVDEYACAFDGELKEWLDYLCCSECVLLALERSCYEAVLLPWDMRAVRLATAPPEVLDRLHFMLGRVPRDLSVWLAYYVYGVPHHLTADFENAAGQFALSSRLNLLGHAHEHGRGQLADRLPADLGERIGFKPGQHIVGVPLRLVAFPVALPAPRNDLERRLRCYLIV